MSSENAGGRLRGPDRPKPDAGPRPARRRKLEDVLRGSRLKRAEGGPVWRQVEEILRQAIRERRFLPGERLPTEAEFAEHFRIHRHTFRRAVAALVGDGLVTVRQGQGMTVREEVLDYPIRKRTRFSEIVSGQAHAPTNEVLEAVVEPAGPAHAQALGISPADEVVRVEMLRRCDDVPTSLSTDVFPASRFPGLADRVRETRSITAALVAYGIGDYRRLRSTLHTRLPTGEEARLLAQSPQQPVLCVDSVNVDPDGRIIEVTEARFAGARIQILVEPAA